MSRANSRKRMFAAVGCAILVAGVVTACGSNGGNSGNGAGLTTLKIGAAPYQDTYMMKVGIEKGFFKDEGIDVDMLGMENGAIAEAVTGGSIDMGALCDVDTLVAYPQSSSLRITNPMQIFQGSSVLAHGDSSFNTYDDFIKEGLSEEEAIRKAGAQLEGGTVIAARNSDQELAPIIAAKKGGVDPDSMHFIDLATEEGVAAFLSGEGDFYSGGLPQRATAVKNGAKVILSGEQLAPEGVVLCGLVTTQDFVDKHEDVLVKWQHAWYRTMAWIDENQSEGFQMTIDALAKDTGLKVSMGVMEAMWNKQSLFPSSAAADAKAILNPDSTYYWRDRFENALNYYEESGNIEGDVDLDTLYAVPKIHDAYVKKYGEK